MPLTQRLHRLRVVPVVGRGDDDDVDVGTRAELAVVVIDGALVDAGRLARALLALVPDVVDGNRLHVAGLLAAFHDAADVRVHAAAAADEADVDAIVGADDPALRRQGRLARIDRDGGNRGSADSRSSNLLDEIAARAGVFDGHEKRSWKQANHGRAIPYHRRVTGEQRVGKYATLDHIPNDRFQGGST